MLNSDGNFLTLEEFQNKFDIKVNYSHYFQLIAAIPSDLKRKALDSSFPDLLCAPSEYFQLEDRTNYITNCLVLTKFRSKNYFKLFIEILDTETSAIRSCKKYFPELPDWSNCFVDIYKSSKVMHRIIPTKKELMKYKLASDDKCPLCFNPDSTEHTLIHSQELTDFFM